MVYVYKLILRLITAFLIVLFGSNILFKILFSPMLYLSYFLLLPYQPNLLDNILIIGTSQLEFISACIATSAYLLLFILILLTKDISFIKGIKVFITGFITLFFVNMLRIYILALVLINFDLRLFEALHIFFWQVFSTAFVLLLWIGLTNYFKIKSIPIYSDFKYLKEHIRII